MALLTVRAAAQRLGVGYSTLKQWIYSGTVRTTTTAGGHHRIADAEIERLIARGNPSSPAAKRKAGSTGLIVALSGRNRLRGFVEEVRRGVGHHQIHRGDDCPRSRVSCQQGKGQRAKGKS